MQRRGGAAALLQKVNYQLKGEKPRKTEEEEDEESLDAYFSSLSKRSKKNEIQWDKFGESDLDISEHEDVQQKSAGSKFLKKKQVPQESPGSKFLKKQEPKKSAESKKPLSTGKSSALSKASAFTSKYATSKSSNFKRDSMLSESDMDLSISMDEDVVADMQRMKAAKVPSAAPVASSYSAPQSASSYSPFKKTAPSPGPYQSALLADTDDDSSSMQIGKGGSKFLKKKKPEPDPEPEPEIPEEEFRPSKKSEKKSRPSMYQLKSAEKYSTKVTLDTDEESMQDFIGGLSSSSGGISPKSPGRSPPRKSGRTSPPKVTPRGILKTPRSARSAQSPSTMELISEEESDHSYKMEESDQESVSSAASFKSITEEISEDVNVMDLDVLDLAPAAAPSPKKTKKVTKEVKLDTTPRYIKEKPKKKEKKDPDVFSSMGLQTVDDLLGGDVSDEESEPSEVHTAGATSDIATVMEDSGRQTPLRSILSSPQPGARKSRSSGRARRVSLKERTRSPSPEVISTARGSRTSIGYDDDFEESIATEQPSSIKTEQDETESEIETVSYSSSPSRSRKHSYTRTKSEDYYSDDFTSGTETSRRRRYSRSSSQGSYSEDFTDYSETDYSSHWSSTKSGISKSSKSAHYTTTNSYTSFDSQYSISSNTSTQTTRTPSPTPRLSKPVKTNTREVQTGVDVGLVYHWNVQRGDVAALGHQYGLASVDPTPIATHVVGPDAIEAMTAYSPSVIALNDMLRQQLQMTTSFIDTQRRLHRDLIQAANVPDFNYTTLEDTKRYIKQKKKKPISFKEALKQVKAEMHLE